MMKKQTIFSFLLGGFTFLCIGAGVASTTEIITVKPKTPKSVTVKDFEAERSSEDVASYIRGKVREGWILKSVSAANYSNLYSTWIVVMEKH